MSQLPSSANTVTYPTSRVISYGLAGGVVGALVMGVLALMMPIPNTSGAPFFVAAAMVMGMGSMATAAGWGLHLITGLIIGAVFGTIVAKVSSLHPRTAIRATALGATAGFVAWVVFFIPMMVMLMPALTGMPMLVGGSLIAHVIFGLVLGGVTSLAIPKEAAKAFKCEACGEAFSTREALKEHGKVHVEQQAAAATARSHREFECSACGMNFHSEAELAAHAQTAHSMPARQRQASLSLLFLYLEPQGVVFG